MDDINERDDVKDLSQEELDKVAGGWYDLPANAPTSSVCPQCGTTCFPRTIKWGQRLDGKDTLPNNRVIGDFECPSCGFEWEISNKIA